MPARFRRDLALAVVAVVAEIGLAQTGRDTVTNSVRISGIVTDPSGVPVPGAKVKVFSQGENDPVAAVDTDQTGSYSLAVQPGQYELRIDATAFARATRAITVQSGENVTIAPVILEVAHFSGPAVEPFTPALPARTPILMLTLPQAQDKPQQGSKTGALWAALAVQEPIVTESGAEDLQVYFAIVNDGTSTVDPRIESSRLLINGVEPKDWSFVIGNGLRNSLWHSLPPGEVLRFSYVLGRYFVKPGVYTVRWEGDDFRSPELTFRVVMANRSTP